MKVDLDKPYSQLIVSILCSLSLEGRYASAERAQLSEVLGSSKTPTTEYRATDWCTLSDLMF